MVIFKIRGLRQILISAPQQMTSQNLIATLAMPFKKNRLPSNGKELMLIRNLHQLNSMSHADIYQGGSLQEESTTDIIV